MRFEPALRGHFIDHRLSRVPLGEGEVTVVDLNPGIDYGTLPNQLAQATALAQPAALAIAADGSHAWVAAFGSDRVAKVLSDGAIATRVDLRSAGEGSRRMRGPRGLAWDESRGRLYVFNKLANSLSLVDTTQGTGVPKSPRAATIPCLRPSRKAGGLSSMAIVREWHDVLRELPPRRRP